MHGFANDLLDMSLFISKITNSSLNKFYNIFKGGEKNNIEEATVHSLFASGYETKVSQMKTHLNFLKNEPLIWWVVYFFHFFISIFFC